MKTFIAIASFAAASLLTLSGARAAEVQKFKLIHVADLVAEMQTVHPTILDANGDKTRNSEGIIPGAKLLSSCGDYDVAKELPASKDSELVFYCGNTKCMASHSAANRAVSAGYTHVAVLADGIAGWKAAGQQTAKP
jgi:rhodanese-related sulfurtransferase